MFKEMAAIRNKEIFDFLDEQKEILLKIYNDKGSQGLRGHNGPYKDQETGIRGQAHLVVLLSNLDRARHEKVHESIVIKLVNDILNSSYRKDKIVFIQRNKPGKDEINGVIGIAWIIEAMSCAVEVYGIESAKHFLSTVEDSLQFDLKRSLWYRPDVCSSKYTNTIDETFNHQLWLAYSLIYSSKVLGAPISSNVRAFFHRLNLNMLVRNDGLIGHQVGVNDTIFNALKHQVKLWRNVFLSLVAKRSLRYKEYGYHLFNMYAFARIENLGFGFLFHQNRGFKKAILFCTKDVLLKSLLINRDRVDFYIRDNDSGLMYNRYGFPYNVSGFEFLYVNKVFNLNCQKILETEYWEAQLNCFGIIDKTNVNKSKIISEDELNLFLRSYELSNVLNS